MEMPADINRDDVQRFMTDDAQLVEVLPAKEYSEAHLPEAINIPLKELNAESVKSLDPTRPVITYCNDFQ
jgi:rhodanese-related sulfurtransferase